jgi:hypothetical protein
MTLSRHLETEFLPRETEFLLRNSVSKENGIYKPKTGFSLSTQAYIYKYRPVWVSLPTTVVGRHESDGR